MFLFCAWSISCMAVLGSIHHHRTLLHPTEAKKKLRVDDEVRRSSGISSPPSVLPTTTLAVDPIHQGNQYPWGSVCQNVSFYLRGSLLAAESPHTFLLTLHSPPSARPAKESIRVVVDRYSVITPTSHIHLLACSIHKR